MATKAKQSKAKENPLRAQMRTVIERVLCIEDPSEITDKASIADDLGADSLDVVELVMGFEEEFDIEIPDDDADKVKTVEDAYKLVERIVEGRPKD